MEEYIKKLLEQIRFQKAHKAIEDEIRLHIEDQIKENISGGMDKETAEKKAVEDMGDPVDAGIALDKVHRPHVAVGVIVIALVSTVIGTIVNVLLSNIYTSYDIWNPNRMLLRGSELYIYNAILGIIVMLILYFIDYTTVARYSVVAAIAVLIATVVGNIFGWTGSLAFLMIPLFAGILYKYREQKYRALTYSLLWIIATGVIASRQEMRIRAVIIVICMLVELTFAIKNEWLKVPKIPVLVSVWVLFTVFPVGLIWFLYKNRLMSLYQCNVIRTWFIPDNDMEKSRGIIKGMSIIGSGIISYEGGGFTSTESTSNCVRNMYGGEYVLTDMMARWGLLAALVAVTVVSGLIVYGFVTVSKTKNQLGLVMGSGCMMWLTINAIYNAGVGVGLLKINNQSFFPFLSARQLVASYAILGIILSIYKYKNAYSKHVDISRG
ncbi:MAG: permease prefix domain 1-containing protein [Butyrivibrio hungatei]|nr:permease prefix domain 1-containing protein [Butyrivibrio hungatei]